MLRLVNEMVKQPNLTKTSPTNLTPLLESAHNAIKRRSLIFIISDFISVPGWERQLKLLNRRHEVVAIRLWDRLETDLPDFGPVIIQDAESGEQIYVDTHDKQFRQRFQEASRRREMN